MSKAVHWTKLDAKRFGLEWDSFGPKPSEGQMVPKQFGRAYVTRASVTRDDDNKHSISGSYYWGSNDSEWIVYFDHQCDAWSVGNQHDLLDLIRDLNDARRWILEQEGK